MIRAAVVYLIEKHNIHTHTHIYIYIFYTENKNDDTFLKNYVITSRARVVSAVKLQF